MFSAKELYAIAKQRGLQQHVLQFEGLLTMLQYKKPYEITSRYIGQSKEVLDWGCGNGHFSYFLTQNGVSVTGFSFDPSPIFLRGSPLFEHALGSLDDPVTLPFAIERFDAVFSVGVLEHVYQTGGDEIGSLKEICRVLRSNGRFFCFHFPNKYQWIEPVARLLGGLEHFHERKYSIKQIRSFLDESGFTLLDWGRYNFLPRNQLRKLPASIKDNPLVVAVFQWLDQSLSILLPMFCTNFYFVAEKK